MTVLATPAEAEPRAIPGASITPIGFTDLPGWADDDHGQALGVLIAHCRAVSSGLAPLRAGLERTALWHAICRDLVQDPAAAKADARGFFERRFAPYEVRPEGGSGFLTGYYEPEVEASLVRTAAFQAPLLARPDNIETIPQGETRPGIPEGFAAAWRNPDGILRVAPDRGAILDGALGEAARPILWLRDDVEVFFLQVQGSGRARLPDGRSLRIAYSGRNGHPYTMIGRVLVQEGKLPLEQARLEPMKAWLRANADEARRIMRMNRSYVFFRIADELPPDAGPIGGAGLPLTPWRSIAVDRTIWPYGLPIWIDAVLPQAGGDRPFRRLTFSEDTGAAIVGAARADLFHGSGFEAGVQASSLRHPMRFVVLWPKP